MSKEHVSIRLFKNPVLEAMTHIHPAIPAILWSPIILALFYQSHQIHHHSLSTYFLWALIGLLVWTLTEYGLHRFVFHYEAASSFGKRLVYLFHGLHHDDPQDGRRLVMPPVPALLIVGVLYLGFKLVIAPKFLSLFMAFFLIGYLAYDYIHYATHHFPMTSPAGRFLRAYHLKHHYNHRPCKYGVSSPLWDYILKTVD
ncbi:MAG: fatty acid hydroxylase [Bdellovibrionales bacterium GWA2_49_15]|nr:MAG: fatty acid hydroxylase [Bdellovibrionales bacterium GWA2_49_15]HAZ12185.1 fatty acid hydroxylase [Bdellovibrionales bacterium]